jgi:hypothetical protein
LPGFAETVKSGVVARTGLGSPTVPNTISVSSTRTIVLESKRFRNRSTSPL